ncbi:MAG: hypothetical protein Q9212_006085 [Teloschistes hypoglaucus]
MIPLSIVEWLLPSSQSFTGLEKTVKEHVSEARQAKEEHDRKGTQMDIKASVFRYIMGSDMPESERSNERLTAEGILFFAGGTATTARTLTFISYYILSRPDVLARLQEELKDIMAGYPERVPSWSELERLPYLQALIKEGLRRSYGIMHRLPRCSPDVPIQYKQWTIPKNVPVGMSAYFMHNDPSVYPNPLEFTPERWLGDIDPAMTQQFVPFTKGSRNCIGSK